MSLLLTRFVGSGARVQAQQDDATFSSDVQVVNLLATVRNKKAEIVRDLTKDDFSLLEDGRPQTIRYFARESDLPLTIGLMVDTSMSQVHVLDAERGASFRFLDQVLRENKDHVFIMQFDLTVQTRQALTGSRRDLTRRWRMSIRPRAINCAANTAAARCSSTPSWMRRRTL